LSTVAMLDDVIEVAPATYRVSAAPKRPPN
jgi:hypothetical protein